MVGCGARASVSVLARATLVRWRPGEDRTPGEDLPPGGDLPPGEDLPPGGCPPLRSFDPGEFEVVYDRIVTPTLKVKDHRTAYSGITKEILLAGLPTAPLVPFSQCRAEVAALLSGALVVGHALHNDFEALKLRHPEALKRDTALHEPLMGTPSGRGRKLRQRKLRDVFQEEFGVRIQEGTGGHSSAEDASAALAVYLKHRESWERSLPNAPLPTRPLTAAPPLRLLLDGSNLPISFKLLSASPPSFSLTQRRAPPQPGARHGAQHASFEAIDWGGTLEAMAGEGGLLERAVV
jgi:DNA polymerase III epsilon subunit-like protein